MNLYSKKQRWKIILVAIAAVIVGTSLWITGNIVTKIKYVEKRKVDQWAKDIRSNIEQVNVQDSLLEQQTLANNLLIESEKNDIQDWVGAMHELSNEYEDYSFFIKKIQSNNKIPLIMINHEGKPTEWRNLPFDKTYWLDSVTNVHISDEVLKRKFTDSLVHLSKQWSQDNAPIELAYLGNQNFKVYYSQSEAVKTFQLKSNAYRAKSMALLNDFNTRLDRSIILFPMAYVDINGRLISSNLDRKILSNSNNLKHKLVEMEQENGKIPVEISGNIKGYIYYQNSDLVEQLSYYPYIQFGIIGLFLLVSYFLFSTFRKAEQNQVWVGMAKETAHQLGTPISSLMAWSELLKTQGIESSIIVEINKDLSRLETVTDRFSKIGSGGDLKSASIIPVVERVYDYLGKRVSKKLEITISGDASITAMINEPLLEWVIENLSKNGVDAMEGNGGLNAHVSEQGNEVYLDISDTGKGISAAKFKTVFEPGYTSKKRGWGLGLSLVKRIVEAYHKGKVFVLKSEINKGTTFRVVLQKM